MTRKIAVALASLIALSICACDGGSEGPADTGSPDGGSKDGGDPRWPACSKTTGTQTITFLHVSDIHGGYTPGADLISPVARLRGFYEQTKAESPYTVFTNAGDDMEKGSIAELLSSGASTIEVTRAMRYDVRTIGNHDFAYSPDEALEYSVDPYSAVLSTNTTYSGAGTFGALPFVAMEIGCVKVGFFGLTSRPWNELDKEYEGEYYPGFTTGYDFKAVVQKTVDAHRGEVDLLVMVSHLGYPDDMTMASDIEGVDVILSGHTHLALDTAAKVNETTIIACGESAEYAGRLDVKMDIARRKPVSVKYKLVENTAATMQVDIRVQAEVDRVLATYAPDWDKAVAWASKDDLKSDISAITIRAARELLPADAAIIDPSTIWMDWTIGVITMQDLPDTYKVEREKPGTPGFNSTYTAKISGENLLKLKDGVPSGWSFAGPEEIKTGVTYTIAVQKRAGMHPDKYFPLGVTLEGLEFRYETWDLLNRYAAKRAVDCLYIDADTKRPDCK
ncbi:MAG: metallophosphoesterase [Myxococcota bacterium]|jgi:hypothetical protein